MALIVKGKVLLEGYAVAANGNSIVSSSRNNQRMPVFNFQQEKISFDQLLSVAKIEGCGCAVVVSMAAQMVGGTQRQYSFAAIHVLYGCGIGGTFREQW